MIEAAHALLERYPCPGVTAEQLVDALSIGAPTTWTDGEALCEESRPAHAVYVLLSGSVRVCRTDPRAGQLREVARIDAPALVGHMAVIDDQPRTATCLADGRLDAVELEAREVRRLVQQGDARGTALRRILISALMGQLTAANQRIQGLTEATEDLGTGVGPGSERDASEEALHIEDMLDGFAGPDPS